MTDSDPFGPFANVSSWPPNSASVKLWQREAGEKRMRNIGWIAGAVLLLGASAASATYMPKDAEASLLVNGTIVVAADGSVVSHALDHPELLDAGVVGMVDSSMTQWHFKPMHGTVTGTMHLVLHAKKNDAGKYRIWIAAASFASPQEPSRWEYGERTSVDFPSEAAKAGVGGMAYVCVHVDRDGNVIDAITEQVNLTALDTPIKMEHWRDVLGSAATNAIKKWRFHPVPNSDAALTDDTESARTLRVPVHYSFPDGGQGIPKYGQWSMYVPGPHHDIPWLVHEDAALGSPEALAAGGLYPIHKDGLHLVTQLATD